MQDGRDRRIAQAGRRVALLMAGTGLFWIAMMWVGEELGLSNRMRALFDLIALAGFGLALWMTIQLWRFRQQQDKR